MADILPFYCSQL